VIPVLHVVTDDEILARPRFVSRAMGILEAGDSRVALHLRGPRTSARFLYSLAETLKVPANRAGVALLSNDRLDLTLVLDLPGAHLGQRSVPPAFARKIMGPRRLLGLSVHGWREAAKGLERDLDFLLVGTLYPSPSHPERRAGGLGLIAEVKGVLDLPLLGIGGVSRDRVGGILAAGAHGIAVKGGIWDSPDPAGALRGYLEALAPGRSL